MLIVKFGEEIKKENIKYINNYSNLYMFWREKISYSIAKQIFNTNNYLCPDMALYLKQIEKSKIKKGEKGKTQKKRVLLCFRNDCEKIIDTQIENTLKKLKLEFDYTDTINSKKISLRKNNKVVSNKIDEFSNYDLVITDRLHGMILSMLAKTPCIAFDNINHKVSSVYETWLIDNKAIKLLDNKKDLEKTLKSMIKITKCEFEVNKELYSELSNILLD